MKHSALLPYLLIICIGTCIYYPAMNGAFIADDYPAIVNNAHLYQMGDFDSIRKASSKPTRFIPFMTFALNFRIHQLDVFGYHVFNLIIHLITSSLAFWLTILMLNTPALKNVCKFDEKLLFALMTALVFLTHPIQTQAVSYIHQRIASIATLFYLLTLCLYIQARANLTKNLPHRLLFASAIFVAFVGMFTKEIIFTLPFSIILIEWCLFIETGKRGLKEIFAHLKNKKIFSMIILFLLNGLIIPLIFIAQKRMVFKPTLSQSHVGDIVTSQNYFLTQFRVIAKYVRLLFFPYNQTFDYDFAVSSTLFEPTTFFAFIFVIIILALGFYLHRRNILVAFGIFWFFITLSVESTFIPIRNVIWEHRLYLPMFGFALLLSAAIFSIVRNKKKYIFYTSCLIILFSLLTINRNMLWRDPLKFWQDNTEKAPQKPRSHALLAGEYIQEQSYDLAQRHAQKSIELDPTYYKPYFFMSAVHSKKKEYATALDFALRAYQLYPQDVLNARQLGYIHLQLGNYDQSFEFYETALSMHFTEKNIVEYSKLVLLYYKETKNKKMAIQFAERLRKFNLDGQADWLKRTIDGR